MLTGEVINILSQKQWVIQMNKWSLILFIHNQPPVKDQEEAYAGSLHWFESYL